MAGIEHQVLELVAFIDKKVVDTHHLEVHGIVFSFGDAVLYVLQLGFKRLLALLQAFEHTAGDVRSLHTKYFKVLLHGVHLLLQDSLLYLQGLRYHAELLVRQDNTIPIVVLDVVEDALAVLLAEIVLARIENLGIGISLAERIGNIEYICLQSDNHRLVSKS
ncbi:hypothetical protein IX324_003040 [Bacteroides pyogenes]|nr:hypothetical protein [Bacteroides pyogenes]